MNGNASLTYVRLQVCSLATKWRTQAQNLLINISKVSLWLKDSRSNMSHLVCVFPVYLCALHFPFGFWSRQERRGGCKDIAALEREDGLLHWLQPTGWIHSLGLKSPKNGCEIWFIYPRETGEREGHLGGGLLGRGGTLSTKRCWNYWWLELWTGGNLSALPACGTPVSGSHIGHRLCHVADGWLGLQRGAQAKSLWGGQNCRFSLCFVFTLPVTTPCRKAEYRPFLMPNSLCFLLCSSEMFWLIIIS